MLSPLRLLIIFTLCWQCAFSRHLGQQPYYMPYSDYSYTYSGPGPLHHQHQHSPFFSPPGTYFDHRQGILRPFPGGGVPVLVDYHKRCSNQYVGLKAHPDQHQYYYVCKPDCVIFGKCQNLQIFNATCGQCVQHPPPEYKLTCTEVGRFPLFSDCHLYYKCEEDLQPKIYSCPASMVFSPTSKKCINGHKCTPTQISPHSSYIPEVCASKFPPCFENGIFRSPSDCSLYYKCDLKSNGVYMQTRLRCRQGNFYDLQKHECLPAKEVPCDCIQVAELVYPKPHLMSFQPAVYPAPFELDSLEDGYYPVEQMKEESNSDSKSDEDFSKIVTTTLAPSISETTLNKEAVEPNDMETAVLSDYIDMGDEDDKSLSKELEALTPNRDSSEETANTEDSTFEADSEEEDHLNQEVTTNNEIEGIVTNVTEENENVTETATTIKVTTEVIDESHNLIEESIATEEPSNGKETEMKARNLEQSETATAFRELEQEVETTTAGVSAQRAEVESTTASKELEQEEEVTTAWTLVRRREEETTTSTKGLEQEEETITSAKGLKQEEETTTPKVSTRSIKSQPCENAAELGENNDTDTHTKDTTQTQTNNCLGKLTTSFSDIDSDPKKDTIISENTEDFRNTLHEHNSTIFPTVTTIPKRTLLAAAKIIPTPDNLVATQLPTETSLVPEQNTLLSNLLDSEISSQQTKPNIEQTVRSLEADIEKPTTNDDTIKLNPNVRTLSIDTNSVENDVSFEDILDIEAIKIAKMHSLVEAHSKELLKERELTQKADEATQSLHSPRKLLRNTQLETEKTLQPETTTIKIAQATTIKLDSRTPNEKHLLNGTTDSPTSFTVGDANFETSTETEESPLSDKDILLIDTKPTTSNRGHISTNEDSVDFSKEEFIPVHSKTIAINELPEETTDFENRFEDDYTTIISEKEFNTAAAATTIKGITQQEQAVKTVQSVEKETTLRRRQATLDGTTQLTTIKAPTQTTLTGTDASATTSEQPNTTVKTENNSTDRDYHEVLNSDVVIHGQTEEVSNNEITSAEKIETSSKFPKPEKIPHTPFPTFTLTQTTTVRPKFTTTEPSEQQTDNLTVHVRKEYHKQPSLDSSSSSQSLYYTLETTPVITNNDNKTNNNETVTAVTPGIKPDNGNIPRLEIIAERPIDVHLSICSPTCNKNHTHNEDSPIGKRAVLLKWFANKSKQTMGFETANEVNNEDDRYC